jgi:phenylacetate-coenzyme A ligase PaaK-like adenylate-forming protein
MSSLINNTSASPTTPVLRLAATDGIDKIVPQLNAWQPEMLVAYASLARLLAEEQLHGRLNIHPRSVVTNGEVLTHEARQRIKVAWGTEPFNQYGATEAGQIAAECEQHRGMHLFEDLALVEVVDERNRPVPPGTYGEKVLVTVFFNHVQPLIRYELTDSIKLATESCPCGRSLALIEDIQGRVEQVLHLPGCNGGQVAVHPLTFHKVMDTVPVHGWQVVYNTSGLTILLCGASSEVVDATLIEKVSRELLAQGVSVPTVETRRVLLIPRTSAGKSPLVKSMVTE